MTPERRAEISRMGALAAHAKGTAHRWTSDEARVVGRKGGKVSGERKRAAFKRYDSGGDILPDGRHVDPLMRKRGKS